jgi:hypothetical protein
VTRRRQLSAAQLEAATLADGRRRQVRDLDGQLATATKLPVVPPKRSYGAHRSGVTVPTEAELRALLRAGADQVNALIPPEDAR